MTWIEVTGNWQEVEFYGEGDGTPLQDSCLENPMDGGAWQTTVHGVTKSQAQLSGFTCPVQLTVTELNWSCPATTGCVI